MRSGWKCAPMARALKKRRTCKLAASVWLGVVALPAAPLLAYTPGEVPTTQPAEPNLEGPHFFNLRYREDYSYLDDHPEADGTDPFLRLKNIRLGDEWRVDFGGETRARFENRTNRYFGLSPRTSNTQQNYRHMLHANVKYSDTFRLFAQGIFAHVEDQDGPFQPTQEDHGDFQQLFGDFRLVPDTLTLRVGRQEMEYGNSRVVGPLDWVSTRRKFDAAKLLFESTYVDVDVFYAKPVSVDRTRLNHWDHEYDFYGAYATYKGIPDHGVDAYFFAKDQTRDLENPNGHLGDQSIYTVGSRFWGQPGNWDYDAEFSGQWGTWAGDRVNAWAFDVDGGYSFDIPLHPRLGAGLSLASGDDDPRDQRVDTYDQLFPFDDVCIGILDLVGRQNLNRAYVSLDFWPVEDKVLAAVYLHAYWLNSEKDYYYDVGGSPLLRDRHGHSGTELGQELDLWLEWFIDPHSSLVFAYSHFWNGPYVNHVVDDDDQADLIMMQYRFRF